LCSQNFIKFQPWGGQSNIDGAQVLQVCFLLYYTAEKKHPPSVEEEDNWPLTERSAGKEAAHNVSGCYRTQTMEVFSRGGKKEDRDENDIIGRSVSFHFGAFVGCFYSGRKFLF